jgi:hypothetical protein
LKGGKKSMKKFLKNFLIIFAIIAVVITPFYIYIEVNKERLIYDYMLYDYIQYNGHDYDMIKGHYYCPSNEGEVRGPVYLVKASKVYKKNSYTAYVYTGYEGEEEEIYMFFDSAEYMRTDYMKATESGD